ncbi:MAG: GntR family transcriptional regulator [Candidatus Latescibacteria bacterium]|nr:GntR family transcriptional regulator [Candidatus Latescibacterota bacterium]
MEKTPIVHRTIREQVVSHLRHAVLAGELGEGEALREQPLARHFGVSRGPIRDALLQLTQEGLLVAEQNRGVRVRRPDPAIGGLVVELRRKIESFALKGLCQGGDEALAFFSENLSLFQSACRRGDMAEVVEHDMAFHRYIVESGGGADLVAVWVPVVTHMMLPYSRHGDLMDSYREHEAVVQALRRGDEAAALECLRANIQ